MRPTLPLSTWIIAVDLDATRSIRRQGGHPAEECLCADCMTWKRVAAKALPSGLDEQLKRLGIEKDKPTDLYVYGRHEGRLDFRVMFHVVGKILSGASPWLQGSDEGRMHNYHVVQSEPTWVGLRVSKAWDSFEYAPHVEKDVQSDVVCIDFRLQVLV
ncbi:hypothetical protein [Pseudoxanthomonas sp. PXM02]|uniref:hypothetical protein n=1 Tax=Pseudoxanthomonas sp. PXM02 TaxID=2769294 RepID=UPI001782CCA3|nr:hypothetical protein [Pseudoxanthomonas sp. PXM02]MBD9478498.1 hypothetical protein [Pseudoxanthomonas sp. PXM02]